MTFSTGQCGILRCILAWHRSMTILTAPVGLRRAAHSCILVRRGLRGTVRSCILLRCRRSCILLRRGRRGAARGCILLRTRAICNGRRGLARRVVRRPPVALPRIRTLRRRFVSGHRPRIRTLRRRFDSGRRSGLPRSAAQAPIVSQAQEGLVAMINAPHPESIMQARMSRRSSQKSTCMIP